MVRFADYTDIQSLCRRVPGTGILKTRNKTINTRRNKLQASLKLLEFCIIGSAAVPGAGIVRRDAYISKYLRYYWSNGYN
jgi:hypothetical protein